MKTYKERLEAGLKAMGWTLDGFSETRVKGWTKPGVNSKLFVGPNGGLRAGQCKSQSHSIGDATRQTAFYKEVLAKGDSTFPVKVDRTAEKAELLAMLEQV